MRNVSSAAGARAAPARGRLRSTARAVARPRWACLCWTRSCALRRDRRRPRLAAALNPAGTPYPDGIPGLVWNVVGRLPAIERGEDPERPARVRARARRRRLGDRRGCATRRRCRRASRCSIRAAGVDDVLGLVSRASGLTRARMRARGAALEGLDTRELAERLFISRHTVQDHLKSVFEKVGVRSRRELVSASLAGGSRSIEVDFRPESM